MIKRNKVLINILCIINVISLILFSIQDNLFYSNLSRIANSSRKDYFLFLFICILFGIEEYLMLKSFNEHKYYIIGIISLLIGGVFPYNYLNTLAFSSNLHLICGFLSIVLILFLEIILIIKIRILNIKLFNLIVFGLFFIALITLYLYSTYGFMNSLNELIYLIYIIFSHIVLNNLDI